VSNRLVHNGTNPTTDPQFAQYAPLAADLVYLAFPPPDPKNCFGHNTFDTSSGVALPACP